MEEFVGIRVNESTRTLAVHSETECGQRLVDVYRLLRGRVPEIWPRERTSELPLETLRAIAKCEVQLLYSWVTENRIEDLWPVDVDGAVLCEEWAFGESDRSLLVMRDGSGSQRWVTSPRRIFEPEERGGFEYDPHGYRWREGVGILADGSTLCIFGRGGVVRFISVRDGKVIEGALGKRGP